MDDGADDVTGDDATRIRHLLAEASGLLGEGPLQFRLWSVPVVEVVFVGVEDGEVVVSDNGETFAEIAGIRSSEPHLPWSVDAATTAAARFDVELADEGEEGGYEGFRIRRIVDAGESIAEAVQAVAQAIDGTFALHTPADSPAYGSFFWDDPFGGVEETRPSTS